jgi:uncharacterized lipoprotein YajG
MRRLRHALLVAMFLLAGCGAAPTTRPPTNLGVANDTTVTVTIFVNGVSVGDVAAGGVEPSVDGSAVPPLPWTVTVRSASGQVLGTLFAGITTLDGTFSAEFGDLACGRVTVWIGGAEPSEPASLPGGEPAVASLIPCGP